MKLTIVKYYLLILTTGVFTMSCVKDDVKNPLTNQGSTFFKVLEAPQRKIFFSPFTDTKKVDLFSLRKEAATPADLKAGTTVTLKTDTSLLNKYNKDNGDTYEVLPDSLFTLDAAYTKTATGFTTTFNAGDFAKEFIINLNGAKWDLAHKYAVGVTLTDVGGKKISDGQGSILVLISIKNKYAGTYTSNGYLYHPSSPRALTNITKEVITAGPNSVTIDLGDLGTSGYKALVAIDPVTNQLTITAAPGAAGGAYTMFTSGLPTSNPGYTPAWSGSASCNNTYDPTTHTFYLRYGYTGGTGYRVTEEIVQLN